MSKHGARIIALLDDRPDEGVFSVSREAFTDAAVFERELAQVFEGTWVFLGLESQARNPHDFFTTHIGRQPVIVMRDAGGRLGCFLNSCRHRGALVCLERSGNQRAHVCRYHGWSYDSGGRCLTVTNEPDGQYAESFGGQSHDLQPIARFASYRGLLFGSLTAEVPELERHLGDARVFLDLVMDQAERGFELVPGAVTYTFDANWKLQFENGLDFYHFDYTHASYVDVIRRRNARAEPEAGALWVDDDSLAQGTFSFERGHAVMWANRNSLRVKRPVLADEAAYQRTLQRVGPERAKWMLLNRNLTIFPNMQLIDVHSLQLRVWRPLAVDRTEMTSWCLAPIGESAEARRRRIRQYEDFFNPTGLATSDDNVMYEFCQAGLRARAGDNQGYLRGMGAEPAHGLARKLQIEPADAVAGSFAFGGETCMHAGYREWHRLLTART